jgi:hypothetical protein
MLIFFCGLPTKRTAHSKECQIFQKVLTNSWPIHTTINFNIHLFLTRKILLQTINDQLVLYRKHVCYTIVYCSIQKTCCPLFRELTEMFVVIFMGKFVGGKWELKPISWRTKWKFAPIIAKPNQTLSSPCVVS